MLMVMLILGLVMRVHLIVLYFPGLVQWWMRSQRWTADLTSRTLASS
jgi:hypothetical protein